MSEERVIPFSNGTEYMCWNEYNCCHCKKYHADDSGMVIEPVCQIDEALVESMFGDGKVSREMADRMGLKNRRSEDGGFYLYWRCNEFVDEHEPDLVLDHPDQQLLFGD